MIEFDKKKELGDPTQQQIYQAEVLYSNVLRAKRIEQGVDHPTYGGELRDLKHNISDIYTSLSTDKFIVEEEGEDKGSIKRIVDPVGKDLADQVIEKVEQMVETPDLKFKKIFEKNSTIEDETRERHNRAVNVLKLYRIQRGILDIEETMKTRIAYLPPIVNAYDSDGKIKAIHHQPVDDKIIIAFKKTCSEIYYELSKDKQGRRWADRAIRIAYRPWDKKVVEEAEKIIFKNKTAVK